MYVTVGFLTEVCVTEGFLTEVYVTEGFLTEGFPGASRLEMRIRMRNAKCELRIAKWFGFSGFGFLLSHHFQLISN